MAKALVFTGGEWIIAEVEEQGDHDNLYLKTESGRQIYVPANDAIVLDHDYQDWYRVAQFLAQLVIDMRKEGAAVLTPV